MSAKIPRSADNDYSPEIIAERQHFLEQQSGAQLQHTRHFPFDPESMEGNCEHLFGVAQVPIGLAGPLLVNGEHAQGDFYVPMATVEGTLIASYNRGMRVIRESGGVTTTVVSEAMQRAPVFMFKNARDGRDFAQWLRDNFDIIKEFILVEAATELENAKVKNIFARPSNAGDDQTLCNNRQKVFLAVHEKSRKYYHSCRAQSGEAWDQNVFKRSNTEF